MAVEMCDTATRSWCCRIGLVLSISSVLLTMMFQIWSYYFYLVREMDTLTEINPVLYSIFSVCNSTINTEWNSHWSKSGSYWENNNAYEQQIYVESSCLPIWRKISTDSCCRVLIWILPW